MISKGRFGGLEVFFTRISYACLDDPILRLAADTSFEEKLDNDYDDIIEKLGLDD